VPASGVFALRVNGDTIAAGVDSTTFVSTDGGATWHGSATITPGIGFVGAILLRNGRLYAGTATKGVFVSDDLGDTWQAFNQGLVGGIANSQLDISDLEVRGDSLLASTFGAGVYVRNLAAADTWHHFGEEFEPNQCSNVNDLALGGTRLLASVLGNGDIFHRDPGDADWTNDFLVGGTLHPGLASQTSLWIGSRWIVGTNVGVFVSPTGESPWTFTAPLPNISWSVFAQHGPTVFAVFDSVNTIMFSQSNDAGTSWSVLERVNLQFAYRLAVHGDDLYIGRSDGLFVRAADPSASVDPGPHRSGLRFALAVQPVRDLARFRFELPAAGTVALELFDVTGRRAAEPIEQFRTAGTHEIAVNERALRPGVYSARLTSGTTRETVRLVRVP